MRLTFDFTKAKRTSDDRIVCITAQMGGAPVEVTLTDDACIRGGWDDGTGLPCDGDLVCRHHAWLAAVVLTGRRTIRPVGEVAWCARTRTASFAMTGEARRAMV